MLLNKKEKRMGKIRVGTIVLIIACLIFAVIGYLIGINLYKLIKKKDPVIAPPVVKGEYKTVKVDGLEAKLGGLDFSNNLVVYKNEGESIFNVIVDSGTAKVTYNIKGNDFGFNNDIVKSYKVSSLNNIVSIGAGINVQGTGSFKIYFLCSDGKVYVINDILSSVFNEENYGMVYDLPVKNATSIAVVDKNFSLSGSSQTLPTVYIKTSDNRLLTDEISFIDEDNQVVEVIE